MSGLMLGITSGGDFLAVKGIVEAIVERLNPSAVVEVADFRAFAVQNRQSVRIESRRKTNRISRRSRVQRR